MSRPPTVEDLRALSAQLLEVAAALNARGVLDIHDLDSFEETLPAAVAISGLLDTTMSYCGRVLHGYMALGASAKYKIFPTSQLPDVDELVEMSDEATEYAVFVADFFRGITPRQEDAAPVPAAQHAATHHLTTLDRRGRRSR